MYALSIALTPTADRWAALINRLMVIDPSSVTNTEALHGVYAMLQIGAADKEDRYAGLADVAIQQSDTIRSRAYSRIPRTRGMIRRFSPRAWQFLSTADSALGVKVTSWIPRRASVLVVGAVVDIERPHRGPVGCTWSF